MASKIEQAWENIFQGENIPQQLAQKKYAIVTSDVIRKKYQARPRILGKMDSADDLPKIFRRNDAALLSLTNRSYIILRLGDKGKPLFPRLGLGQTDKPQYIPVDALRQTIVTLPWERHFSSESQAMDAAVASGILQNFVGDEHLMLTIRGRHRLGVEIPLHFWSHNSKHVFPEKVRGIQMEVDGGYEGDRGVYLIEAKNRVQSTFNLRQVYFPYVHWMDYLMQRGVQKELHPIFMIYTAHQYFLYELEIANSGILNDIHVLRQGWYILGDPPVGRQDMAEILQKTRMQCVPDIPFPQADTFLRVFSLLNEIQESIDGESTADELADIHDITLRQGHYYTDAAQWLGWLERRDGKVVLTRDGTRLLWLSHKNAEQWAQQVFQTLATRPVFRPALASWVGQGVLPDKVQIERWINEAAEAKEIKPLGGSTVGRRARTVVAWLKILSAWVK